VRAAAIVANNPDGAKCNETYEPKAEGQAMIARRKLLLRVVPHEAPSIVNDEAERLKARIRLLDQLDRVLAASKRIMESGARAIALESEEREP
jgi:hypothetical protein